ncbi:MAG: ribonuclease III [Alphaproteobacteria bacterium]|nr:ribonuclease III [Alphaproteobacteria bacterium]
MNGLCSPKLADLQERLDYRFSDVGLLIEALTHGSAAFYPGPSATYQRLEFLGDRVLGLVIADALLKLFPDAHEGELAQRLNSLVRCDTCAKVARDLNLGSCLIIGFSEEFSGGREKNAILADVMESLIGAIYFDSGFEVVQLFVESNWKKYLMVAGQPCRDAKTILQEWVQKEGFLLPVYAIVDQSGPAHEPVFRISVSISGLKPAFGTGKSRRDGEQMAAAAMLASVGIREGRDTPDAK